MKQGIASGKEITVVSDYGHHPNEISATIKAAREKYPNKKIWCVFQPHQHQRTYYLFKDFIKTFRKAPVDKILITDIYDVAGREVKKINEEVNSKNLVKKIERGFVEYYPLNGLENKNLVLTFFIEELEIVFKAPFFIRNAINNKILLLLFKKPLPCIPL